MLFDFLNPFHWITSILSTILVIALILTPGWISVFSGNSFSEIIDRITSDFWSILGKAVGESFNFYKSLFEDPENQEKMKEFKEGIEEGGSNSDSNNK